MEPEIDIIALAKNMPTQEQLESQYGMAHHGEPLMTRRDYYLCMAMSLWIATARKAGGLGYGPEWVPSGSDIVKSRLFWRIRSGKAPLSEPPPRCYSCPWYEVVEDGEAHWCMEGFITEKDGMGTVTLAEVTRKAGDFRRTAVIGQCAYELLDDHGDGTYTVGYGKWRFKFWKGTNDRGHMGAFLQCQNGLTAPK